MKKTPGQLRKKYVLIAGSLISASFVVAESEQQMSVAYTDLISSGLLEGYLSLLCRRLKSTKLQNQDGGTYSIYHGQIGLSNERWSFSRTNIRFVYPVD
jgi:hypothetical protein